VSKKIAICVGHSRSGDNGATTVDGESEWEFNHPVALQMERLLRKAGHDALVFYDYKGSSYSSAMSWVAKEIRDFGASLAVELHFNSGPPTANGYEFLYWHRSARSGRLASCFHFEFKKAYPQLRSRGLKPLNSTSRGAAFVQRTHCPAILMEPFFGSNEKECDFFADRKDELAKVYSDAILNWLESEPK
jgi:N-acetylmuramoyl-L-alanine amidase